MKNQKLPGFYAALVMTAFGLLTGLAHAQYVYTTIDDPVAVAAGGTTYAEGISGNIVVGYYYSFQRHGFYHTLGTTNYVTLDDPAGYANGSSDTACYGISGNNIVGWHEDIANYTGNYGFIYNISTGQYTELENPAGVVQSSSTTETYGIDGNNVVGFMNQNALPYDQYVEGFYGVPSGGGGYSYAEFYYPSPSRILNEGSYNITNYQTYAYGIEGDNVVGFWLDQNLVTHGYVYNTATSSFTMISSPSGGAAPLYGINNNTVVGYFGDPNHEYNPSGFTYNLVTSTYTTLRDPLAAADTYAQGISGTTVVGYYLDNNGITHGFVAAIPVPVLSIADAGTNLVLTATNGVPGASCFVLDTTQPTLPLNQWSELSSNVFNAMGDFSVTNAIVPGMPPTFYALSETP